MATYTDQLVVLNSGIITKIAANDIIEIGGDFTVGGNLTVNGTTTTIDTQLSTADDFILLNSDLVGASAEAGLIMNVSPGTAVGIDNINSGTITTDGAALHGLSSGDFVIFQNFSNPENNGIFEVDTTPTGSTFTVKASPSNTGFNGSGQLVDEASDSTGTIAPTSVTILRSNTSGDIEKAFGSSGSLTFDSLALSGSAGGWTDDGSVVRLTTSTDTVSVGANTATLAAQFAVTGNMSVDGDADEIQLLVQGHSTQTNDIFVVENSAGTDIFQVAASQTTVSSNLDATAGLDVSGDAFTVSGSNSSVDLDPTGAFTLDMDASQTATITLGDGTASALLVQEGANAYLDITTTNTSEAISLGNATTNPTLTQLGTGQVTFNGNVDATSGLDITGANATIADDLFLTFGNSSDTTFRYNSSTNTFDVLTGNAPATGEDAVGIDVSMGVGAAAVDGVSDGTFGGYIDIEAGIGGAATEGTGPGTLNAGTGGFITLTAGNGGAGLGDSTGSNTAGDGGTGGLVRILAGRGGDGALATGAGADNAAPGSGGGLTLNAARGGAGTTVDVSGDGGDVTINAGSYGVPDTAGAGNAGTISIGTQSGAFFRTSIIDLGNSTDNPPVRVFTTTDSTDPTTGALRVAGGVGVSGRIHVGGLIRLHDADEGQIVLPELTTVQTPAAGNGSIFVDTDAAGAGTTAELWYNNNGSSTQITCEGALCVSGNNIINSDFITGSGVTLGHALYLDSAGELESAIASASSTGFVVGFAKANAGATDTVQLLAAPGSTINTASISGFANPGDVVYLSETIAGGLTTTAPTGSGEVIFRVGYAINATSILFQPQFIALIP